jgi:hypothetical protein
MNLSVSIWPSVKQALAVLSEGLGSTLPGQRLSSQGLRPGAPALTLKMSRQAV